MIIQSTGAYVEQIPLGAKPPSAPTSTGVLNAKPLVSRPSPPGLYVQVAEAATQEDAVRSSLEFSQRLGSNRPPFIQGLTEMAEGRPRIVLFAGPFADGEAAERFCRAAMPSGPCQVRPFPPSQGSVGSDQRRAQRRGD